MIRPITCNACKARLAWYCDLTGRIRDPGNNRELTIVAVFGVIFECECGKRLRWNGESIVAKMKAKRNRLGVKMVVANTR